MTSELDYALLANRVYTRSLLNRTPLVSGWQELEWLTDDPDTGFPRAPICEEMNSLFLLPELMRTG